MTKFVESFLASILTLLILFCPALADDEERALKLDLIIVLDNSGSMKQNDPKLLMKDVVKKFVAQQHPNSRIGLLKFDEKPDLIFPLTSLDETGIGEEVTTALQKIDYKGRYTNSATAIERALYELNTKGRNDAEKAIVFLTDGIIDVGNKAKDKELQKWLQEDLAMDARNRKIRVFSVAFTEDADFLLIQSLAQKTDASYYRALKAEEIEDIFNRISLALASSLLKEIEQPAESWQTARASKTQSGITTSVQGQSQGSGSPQVVVGESRVNTILLGVIAAALFGLTALFLLKKGAKAPDTSRPSRALESVSIPGCEIFDLSNATGNKSLKLTKSLVTIGREEGNDIVIAQSTISAQHATIEYKHGYFYLADNRSTNGTFLNNNRVNGEQRLKSGDVIGFDIYKFQFMIAGQCPSGKTELGAPKGTVLRPVHQPNKEPSSDPSHPQKPAADRDLSSRPSPVCEDGASSEAEPKRNDPTPTPAQGLPSIEERSTIVKPLTCEFHPSWKATDVCHVCGKGLCAQCATEVDGKTVCREHAKK
jgi:pSer/pThr/pTyr-binding forkhead associated (FHA) protein/Mg-chelatase subunit ChlD